MNKSYRYWHLLQLFLWCLVSFFIILLWGNDWDEPESGRTITSLFLGAAGVFMLLDAPLYKIGCIPIPPNYKVSEDKAIQRKFIFYLDLFIATLCFVGVAMNWFMYHGLMGFTFTIFIVMFIRFVCAGYAKKLYKDK